MELVPQSMAAYSGPVMMGFPALAVGELSVHPAAHRVVAPGQEPGVVGVQALHAHPGAADAAEVGRGPWWSVGSSASRSARVAGVGGGELVGVDLRLGPVHPTGGLQRSRCAG